MAVNALTDKDGRKTRRLCVLTTVPVSVNAFYGKQLDFLADNGFEVTVITSPDPVLCGKISRRCKLITIPMSRGVSPFADLVAFFRVLGVMRKGKFDMVQYSSPKAALLGSLCAAICRVPVRLYLMWGLYYTGQRGLFRQLLKTAEKVTCSASTAVAPDSEGNRAFAVSERLCPQGKIRVVGEGSANGIDLERFDPSRHAARRNALRKEAGIPENALVIGFTGRLCRDKGINELVRAFTSLEYTGSFLLLVGPLDHRHGLSPETERLLKTHPRIRVTGFRENVEEWLAAMDIFCLPSYREGFGVVNVEASAMGLPVVSTDIPGPRDSVREGTTGLLVPGRDAEALATALRNLTADPALRRRMGEAGKEWAKRFEQRKHWGRILAHKRELLEKHDA